MSREFSDVFNELRELMITVTDKLDVKHDEPGNLYVDTFHVRSNKQRLWFGGVQTKKNYVSYHLMPVYVNPTLLEQISPELRRRMQGKSCFNFKTVDENLFRALAQLTQLAFADYERQDLLGVPHSR